MEKAKELGKRLLESGSARRWILLAALLGAALMVLSGMFSFDKKQETGGSGFEVSDYRRSAQQDLEQLISHIQGAG